MRLRGGRPHVKAGRAGAGGPPPSLVGEHAEILLEQQLGQQLEEPDITGEQGATGSGGGMHGSSRWKLEEGKLTRGWQGAGPVASAGQQGRGVQRGAGRLPGGTQYPKP